MATTPLSVESVQSALGPSYCVGREIGRGGMASVYLAHRPDDTEPVAIKVLRPEVSALLGPERFLREIRIATQLSHSNIVPLLGSGEADGLLYYVMPYIEGETLGDRIAREKQLPVDQAIRVTRDVAEALDYAHAQGIVHRDIKPANILIDGTRAVVADFGLARAVSSAATGGEDSFTSSGLALGTPPYMAPEQGSGGDVDARTDVYALGCVLYEMLAGDPPFVGSTPTAVMAKHLGQPAPSVRVVRRSIPVQIDAAILRALEKAPADRFPTPKAFVAALTAPPAAVEESRESRRLRRVLWTTAGTAVLAFAVVAVWYWSPDRGLDPQRYLVAPFRTRAGAGAARGFDGGMAATLTDEGLRRWTDLRRVDPLRVGDLTARMGPPAALGDALALAREVRAGRLIWGEVGPGAETSVVRASLYDVARSGEVIREGQIAVPLLPDDSLPIRFARLADTLVAGERPRPSLGSPRPFAAVEAYAAGMSAIAEWDLREARERFRSALQLDPGYPAANLQFARISQWLDEPGDEWRLAAQFAATSGGLSDGERRHAGALLALAEERFPEGCELYRVLVKGDSTDFAAWFGLAECQASDDLVIPDARSPSGWQFRSSYHAATLALEQAFAVVPSSFRAYREMIATRLRRVLKTAPGEFRPGESQGPAAEAFVAFPTVAGDTFSFVPYRGTEHASGRPLPDSVAAAIMRARRIVDAMTARWVQTLPRSAAAWEARSLALEWAGFIEEGSGASALGTIREAKRLAADSTARLPLDIADVRLRLKGNDFAAAYRLADSLVRGWSSPSPDLAHRLVPVAGLLGRLAMMERFLAIAATSNEFVTADGQQFRAPQPIAVAALRLLAHSVLGGSKDTVVALEARIERYVASLPRNPNTAALRLALLADPAQFGFPFNGPRAIHATPGSAYLLALQAQLARGNAGRVRRDLEAIARQRVESRVGPADISADMAYQEAWLVLQAGDTARAIQWLDGALENLRGQREIVFSVFQGQASLVHAMALRAWLAHRVNDRATAARWAAAVRTLWKRADRGLAPGGPAIGAWIQQGAGET